MGVISRPLTNSLKKNSYQWGPEANTTFQTLKQAMTDAPVLALVDKFTKPFIVKMDACSKGMGVFLMQNGKPLAYFSKAISPRHWRQYTYEKEYSIVLVAVER